MLRQLDFTIPEHLEEPLAGLADRLGLNWFASPQIVDVEGGDEESYRSTGFTVFSFLVSSIEQDSAAIAAEVQRVAADLGCPGLVPQVRDYADNEDWMRRYRENFKPFWVSPRILIAPPTADAQFDPPRPDGSTGAAMRLIIEPGMAFGTGTHESTRLCLHWLEQIDPRGRNWLDLGAGSGILAIYLLLRGAAAVEALEIDGPAIENLRKNAAFNHVEAGLRVVHGGLENYVPTVPADGLVANITSSILLDNFARMATMVKPGSIGVFAGVNNANADAVRAALSGGHGWRNPRETVEAEWHGFIAETTR